MDCLSIITTDVVPCRFALQLWCLEIVSGDGMFTHGALLKLIFPEGRLFNFDMDGSSVYGRRCNGWAGTECGQTEAMEEHWATRVLPMPFIKYKRDELFSAEYPTLLDWVDLGIQCFHLSQFGIPLILQIEYLGWRPGYCGSLYQLCLLVRRFWRRKGFGRSGTQCLIPRSLPDDKSWNKGFAFYTSTRDLPIQHMGDWMKVLFIKASVVKDLVLG